MKSFYLFLLLILSGQAFAQPPCQLSLDSIQLDMSNSTCNYLQFKYKVSGGTPTAYSWTYGDGNGCSCIKPKHFYTANGSYQVCGRIQDANGCADSLCATFIVNCSDPCDLSEIGIFSLDTLSYSCNEMEFITITSTNARKIRWDFGDGDTSDSKYVVHTYTSKGQYKVRLIVQDSIACADTADLTVDITCSLTEPCSMQIQSVDTAGGANCKTKRFTLFTTKPYQFVYWNYGDGSLDTGMRIRTKVYADTGVFNLCVIAEDSFQCRDTLCRPIRVSCPNTASLSETDFANNRIYPSPFSRELNLVLALPGTIQLFDTGMKMLMSKDSEAGLSTLDLSFLRAGIYLLCIENAQGRYVYQIVKE